MAIDMSEGNGKENVCTATQWDGRQCTLTKGHDGRHRDERQWEWPAGADGCKEPEPEQK